MLDLSFFNDELFTASHDGNVCSHDLEVAGMTIAYDEESDYQPSRLCAPTWAELCATGSAESKPAHQQLFRLYTSPRELLRPLVHLPVTRSQRWCVTIICAQLCMV